jgi:hypothetical protein
MGNLQQQGLEGFAGHGTHAGHPEQGRSTASPDGTSYWGTHWIECYDGKYRRTEPGIRFLVNGISMPVAGSDAARFAALGQEIEEGCLVGRKNRISAWQIAGNAICPVLGAEVLRALL